MATKTAKVPKRIPKGKGGGLLKKKVGPIPLPVLVGLLLLAVFFIYKKRSGATSTTGVDSTATVNPTTTVTPQQAASAGSPSGTNTFDPSQLAGLFTLPSDYVTQSDLQGQLDSLGSNVATQIAGITFPDPQITVNVPPASTPSSDPAKKPATAPQKPAGTTVKVKSTPTKYFTYRKDVVLPHGQSLHFTKGKGYYAA